MYTGSLWLWRDVVLYHRHLVAVSSSLVTQSATPHTMLFLNLILMKLTDRRTTYYLSLSPGLGHFGEKSWSALLCFARSQTIRSS